LAQVVLSVVAEDEVGGPVRVTMHTIRRHAVPKQQQARDPLESLAVPFAFALGSTRLELFLQIRPPVTIDEKEKGKAATETSIYDTHTREKERESYQIWCSMGILQASISRSPKASRGVGMCDARASNNSALIQRGAILLLHVSSILIALPSLYFFSRNMISDSYAST
jgi:hypothetical protein